MLNRRAYLDKNHKLTIKNEPSPEPKEDEILIKIAANGICGSDIHFYAAGRLGNFIVNEPYVPGHEASGTVLKIGKNVLNFTLGEKVCIEPGIPCGRCALCLSGRYNLCGSVVFLSAPPVNGTFCDYITMRADFTHKIPEYMKLEHAALAEPAAVAIHAVNRAISVGSIAGKKGLIFGSGTIGLMVLQAFKAMGGGEVTCADVIDGKLELAKKLGADCIINTKRDIVPVKYADIVFETAGSPVATAQCVPAAGVGGTIVQVGWPAGNKVELNIADIIEKEVVYTSVNRYANAFPAALNFIKSGKIKVDQMITHTYMLDDI